MKLLAKNPADRYPSAEDLRADLRRFRRGPARVGHGGATAAPVAGATAAPCHATAADATRAVPARGDVPAHGSRADTSASRRGPAPTPHRAFLVGAAWSSCWSLPVACSSSSAAASSTATPTGRRSRCPT